MEIGKHIFYGWLNHQLVSGYDDIFCHRLEGTKPWGFSLAWFTLPETKRLDIGRAPKGKYSSNHPFSGADCKFQGASNEVLYDLPRNYPFSNNSGSVDNCYI